MEVVVYRRLVPRPRHPQELSNKTCLPLSLNTRTERTADDIKNSMRFNKLLGPDKPSIVLSNPQIKLRTDLTGISNSN